MVLVRCDMCEEFEGLDSWKDGEIFICKKCAEILSRIRKMEIKYNNGEEMNNRLGLFDFLRFSDRDKKDIILP